MSGDAPETMRTVRSYKILEDVSGETNHPVLGRIAYAFKAGKHVPASEQEELVLGDVLVPLGIAEPVGKTPRPIVTNEAPASPVSVDGSDPSTEGPTAPETGSETQEG